MTQLNFMISYVLDYLEVAFLNEMYVVIYYHSCYRPVSLRFICINKDSGYNELNVASL
jgi:hypothetical protein